MAIEWTALNVLLGISIIIVGAVIISWLFSNKKPEEEYTETEN